VTAFELAKQKRENALKGAANCLPLPFPKLAKKIAGFNRGLNVVLSAGSGIGKTTLAKFLLIHFVDWALANKVELHIRFYLLEENIEIFESTIMIHKLNADYKTRINLDDFNSNIKPLSEDSLKKLEQIEKDYMPKFRSIVSAIDTLFRPTEIMLDAKKFIQSHGTLVMEKNNFNGKEYEKEFIYNNPNAFFALFLDNLGELENEQGADLAGTMKIWSNYALKDLCKRYNYTVFNIQHQSADMENLDAFKSNRMKPSLAGLGDNKRIGRAYRLALGLYSPYRQEQAKHGKYIITGENGYEDYFRSLNVFKNNFGVSGIEDGLFFDGQVIHMEETDSPTLKNKPKEN